jgi:hypothetical protein
MIRISTMFTLTATTMLPVLWLAADHGFGQERSAPVLVREVTAVEITFEKSNPPNLLVSAKGRVATAGYTNPRLERAVYVTPPADGVQDLSFYADPPLPGRLVAQVLTEVEAPVLRIERVPDWVKGVRVHAQTNTMEKPKS